jgi:hypothetical protein
MNFFLRIHFYNIQADVYTYEELLFSSSSGGKNWQWGFGSEKSKNNLKIIAITTFNSVGYSPDNFSVFSDLGSYLVHIPHGYGFFQKGSKSELPS